MTDTMHIYIGTVSPIKQKGVREVIKEFKMKGLLKDDPIIHYEKVQKALAITPLEDQTYECAKERAHEMLTRFNTKGDFFIGIESGLIKRYGVLYEETWCVIYNSKNKLFAAYSSGLELPQHIKDKTGDGKLHHEIMPQIAKDVDSRQTWGIYSSGFIQREESIKESFRNAFCLALTSQT